MSNSILMNPTDELFTDLAPAQAEAVGGGIYKTNDAINVYRHANFGTWLGSANRGFSRLRRANNRISSVIIDRGVWDFYNGFYGTGGRLLTLGRGWWAYVGDRANDRISSFYRRRGT